MHIKKNTPWMLVMSTFPPTECGIATFSYDLIYALNKKYSNKLKIKIAAINLNKKHYYNYSDDVVFQINAKDTLDYINIAKNINKEDKIKLINLQHKFGLFGGEYGEYILPFLEIVNKPVVVTFHSVIPKPDTKMKDIVRAIADRSKALMVMTNSAVDIFKKDYGINRKKIFKVEHGVPDIQFNVDKEKLKKKLKVDGRFILLTFGLFSRGKGIEYTIKALPEVVKKYPEVLYLVIGTHPQVKRYEGETYIKELQNLVKNLKLENNVKFYDTYLTLKQIIEFLQASDIYVTTPLNPNQIVSGTLAYAVVAGKTIISTPFLYAKDLVTPDIGQLVEFKNPKSVSEAIIRIISNPELRKQMEIKSYIKSRNMTWENVASSYYNLFKTYHEENTKKIKKYDVFICHASEDKESFVEPLAKALKKEGINVWYDDFSMEWGDSLRESIDLGLVNSKYGIVVFSKSFFDKNKKWPKHELDGLFAKEINGKKVILPIIHHINIKELLKYSPSLSDRIAKNTKSEGIKKIVNDLKKLLKKK